MRAAFDALASLGYRPCVPIIVDQFSDRELRERLIKEKGMQVLQFWSDEHRETSMVSIPTLIAMKEAVGRDENRIDVQHLKLRLEDR